MSTTRKWLLGALVLALYVAHQDFWNWHQHEPLVFGFLPIGLAYHAGYSVAASIMMWVLVRWAWPSHLEDVEPASPPATPGKEAPK